MNSYDITFSCLGAKREWFTYANSKEDAEEKLLAYLYDLAKFTPKEVIVHKIEKRQPWICTAWNRVLQSIL